MRKVSEITEEELKKIFPELENKSDNYIKGFRAAIIDLYIKHGTISGSASSIKSAMHRNGLSNIPQRHPPRIEVQSNTNEHNKSEEESSSSVERSNSGSSSSSNIEQQKQKIEKQLQIGRPGNEEKQKLEDVERRIQELKERSEDLEEKAKAEQDPAKQADLKREEENLKKRTSDLENAKKDASKDLKKALEDDDNSPLRSAEEVEAENALKERIAKIHEIANNEVEKGQLKSSIRQVIDKKQIEKSEAELRRKREIESISLRGFEMDLNLLIRKQVTRQRELTWTRFNKKYEGTGIVKPGVRRAESKHIPLIVAYMDCSGSVQPYVDKTKAVLKTLDGYVRKKLIRVRIHYVTTELSDEMLHGGGGADGDLIMNSILEERPDNIIILTDADADGITSGSYMAPGGVFFLIPNASYIPADLITRVSGKQFTKDYYIDTKDTAIYLN